LLKADDFCFKRHAIKLKTILVGSID
jgi:hypothetical protein